MLGLVLLGLFLRFAVDRGLPSGFPYVTFFPAVILSSFLFGVRWGSVAAVLSGLCAWYFFIPPPDSFALERSGAVALGFYCFVVVTDILLVHWMQRANANLARERETSRALAETRELLFRELQHRVSNNLQVAAGLLALQKRRLHDDSARLALDEASRRLALIGRISRQLYDAGGATRSMREFLEPLCADVVEASGRQNIRCTITVAEDAPLTPDAAVPLALIVAEAVSNAVEHGFRNRDGGTIEVLLARDETAMVKVEVTDDGEGLPDGFSIEASNSLGLRIAVMLAEQLGGRFDLLGGKGTTARLTLPA
ncbi:sensor histidine kinase [Stakelama saccharophila]|uniref:histidine kinase n=1 Tax=Stakelama saccharophila TaxID=3075605 RepID=A0ABZ0B953_9SPHN|nr:histidine kinase dimerization/phosphoacceptor domain -containing protein [Stakelama sp. W311]WNO53924.1 DUF4118 domain-containing protein [Stakelama sp. W311]